MARSVLIKPVITEKMTMLQEQKNQYAFEVDPGASKIDIQHAIQKKFNVKVESVRTITLKGKRKSQFTKRGRFKGYRPTRKRAIVTLSKESKIDLFETAA
ncbi:MAG: 50S ribosomal protein L23 [Chlorobi bacterium]|nr:50S ribosomal protein L23 [Chlorobiota bacterium]MCI0714929.1 50S ribosomal protein L23 [Chlorobiota bacterium]